MEKVSRAEAKLQGFPRFFTGRPCRRGHIDERLTSNGVCRSCARVVTREWAAADPDRKARKAAGHYARHRTEIAIKARDRYAREREKFIARGRAWRRANPHKHTATARAGHLRRRNATPPWANLRKVCSVYAEARRLSGETGVQFEVDHVVPIKAVDREGKHVCCGLHVHHNLRAVPKAENRRKSNRMPDLGDCSW